MSENIIRVHRPELTEAERERRMEQIKQAAVRLLAAMPCKNNEGSN